MHVEWYVAMQGMSVSLDYYDNSKKKPQNYYFYFILTVTG